MGEWDVKWKTAKKNFESHTGQKKPSQKFSTGVRKSTGIEAALKKCDATFLAIEKEKENSKRKPLVENFRKAIVGFKNAAKAYEGVLEAAMDKKDQAALKPEIEILAKQLDALAATMDAHAKAAEIALTGLSVLEFTAKTMLTNLAGAVKRAELFAAQAKTRGDAKLFNDGIVKAARDITQQVGNVEKLRAKGFEFPNGDPTKFFTIMTDWAQGKRTVKDNATKPDVIREAGAFQQAVAGVKKWAEGAG